MRGVAAESFVANEGGWRSTVENEIKSRRPVVLRMSAESVALTRNDETEQLRNEAHSLLSAGPPTLASSEMELSRRILRDLAEDLRGGLSGLERTLVICAIGQAVAELAVARAGHWLGSGKWLARAAQGVDEELARRLDAALLVSANGDNEPLLAVVEALLAATGGPVPEEWCD